MVTDESIVRTKIRKADFITSLIPEDVYISLFTNTEQYLLASNLAETPYELTIEGKWINRETGEEGSKFVVPVGKMLFLKKA